MIFIMMIILRFGLLLVVFYDYFRFPFFLFLHLPRRPPFKGLPVS